MDKDEVKEKAKESRAGRTAGRRMDRRLRKASSRCCQQAKESAKRLGQVKAQPKTRHKNEADVEDTENRIRKESQLAAEFTPQPPGHFRAAFFISLLVTGNKCHKLKLGVGR